MAGKFINFTNHPFTYWDKQQKAAAEAYGEVVELPFPSIDPSISKEDIKALAKEYCKKIKELEPSVVLCQGEFTFTYEIVNLLKENGIKVIAACSERKVLEIGNVRESVFEFIQFREY